MFGNTIMEASDNRSVSFIINMLPAIVLIIFTATTLNIAGGALFTLTAYLVSTNIPSIYISRSLKKTLNMHDDETLVVNFILGNCLLNLVYLFLNTALPTVSRFTLMATLCSISVLTGLLSTWKAEAGKHNDPQDMIIIRYIGLFLGVIPGVFSIFKSLPSEFWRGEDPWGVAVVARGIFAYNFSPAESFDYFKGYFPLFTSGFYYQVAGIMSVTGAPVEVLVRYGGIVIAGTLTALTYVTVKRFINATGGILAAFFIFLNPYIVFRFSSPLREYYGYVILIAFLLLSNLRKQSTKRFNPIYILIASIMLGVTIINHTITPIFILGVLGLDAVENITKKRYVPVIELITICVFALALSSPYYPFMYQPILDFFSISPSSMALYGAIGVSLFVGLLFWMKDNINEDFFKISKPVKFTFLLLIALIFIVNVYYPPNLGSDFSYGYIKIYDFSPTLSVISLVGFLLLAYFETPLQVYALAIQVSFFILLSYFGFNVPLNRLAVYGMWVMSYAAAQLFAKVFTFIEFESFREGAQRTSLREIKDYTWRNRYVILILFMTMSPYIREAGMVRQSPSSFNSKIMEEGAAFVETLETGDLVVPHTLLVHVVYYSGTPHENHLNIDNSGLWKDQFYSSGSVYDMSDWIQETLPDVKRVHFFSKKSYFGSGSFGSLSSEITDNYGKETTWGETSSFSFEIPFTLDSIPLENTKYIGNNGSIVVQSSNGEWDEKIIDSGNVLYDPDDTDKEYKLFYTGEDASREHFIGYAHSKDGVYWEKGEPLNLMRLSEPYVVSDGVKYVLFAIDEHGSLVRLDSHDGVNWSNTSVIVNAKTGYDFWKIESPIAWIEQTGWNLIYTLTKVNETTMKSTLVRRNSTDGVIWSGETEFDPVLLDKTEYPHGYGKLLLSDRVELNQGVMFLGRFLVETWDDEMQWITGSIWFPEGIQDRKAYLRGLTFTDYPEYSKNVRSIQFRKNEDGRPMFYYIGDGELDGIHLGFVDDNIGLDEEWVVGP